MKQNLVSPNITIDEFKRFVENSAINQISLKKTSIALPQIDLVLAIKDNSQIFTRPRIHCGPKIS